jgi:hypothetical protein
LRGELDMARGEFDMPFRGPKKGLKMRKKKLKIGQKRGFRGEFDMVLG